MGRQRNMPQMKEKENSPEKELQVSEASNLPDTEFKTIVIRMIKELTENFKRKITTIKKRRTHKKEPVRNEGYNI